jgi:hypothetical protein
MRCYNIAITLQLTIFPCSVKTSYNIASHELPNTIFTSIAFQTKTKVYIQVFVFRERVNLLSKLHSRPTVPSLPSTLSQK